MLCLVPAAPFAGFLVLVVFGRVLRRTGSAIAGVGSVGVSATAAFVLGAGAGAALLARLGMPGLLVTPSGATLPVGGWPAAEAA
jgi:hypothetical protein